MLSDNLIAKQKVYNTIRTLQYKFDHASEKERSEIREEISYLCRLLNRY